MEMQNRGVIAWQPRELTQPPCPVLGSVSEGLDSSAAGGGWPQGTSLGESLLLLVGSHGDNNAKQSHKSCYKQGTVQGVLPPVILSPFKMKEMRTKQVLLKVTQPINEELRFDHRPRGSRVQTLHRCALYCLSRKGEVICSCLVFMPIR